METLQNTTHKKRRFRLGQYGAYIILVPASIIAVLPFIWMILGSFKSGREIRQVPPTFLPQDFTTENYQTIKFFSKIRII